MNPAVRIALISSLATVFVVVVLGGGGYFAYTKFISKWIVGYQTARESNAILEAVGKVVLLPSDETPQVTKIIDAQQLKDGDHFFDTAVNGDAVLFYDKSGMLVLFDIKNDKLLNMGFVATGTLAQASESSTASASSSPSATDH